MKVKTMLTTSKRNRTTFGELEIKDKYNLHLSLKFSASVNRTPGFPPLSREFNYLSFSSFSSESYELDEDSTCFYLINNGYASDVFSSPEKIELFKTAFKNFLSRIKNNKAFSFSIENSKSFIENNSFLDIETILKATDGVIFDQEYIDREDNCICKNGGNFRNCPNNYCKSLDYNYD